jgi:hypothetical protein
MDAVDKMIPNGFDPDEITLVLKLGLMCSHPLPNARPSMRQVIQYLDGDMLLPNLSPQHPSTLPCFGCVAAARISTRI